MTQKQLMLIIALVAVGIVALFLLPRFFQGDESASTPSPAATDQDSAATGETNTRDETQSADSSETGVSGEALIGVDDNSASAQASAQAGEVVINVEGGKFYFKPDRIEVPQGATVRVVFHNTEGRHDWVIDAFDARTATIDTGETAEVTFVANKAGSFEYYCSVGNHRELGMKGTLVVTPTQ